jgi:two-component system sensor histidine kinase BarA
VEELKKNRVEFIQLLQKKNITGLEAAAHRLHGACCFCGVPTLQSHVARLEHQAKQTQDIDELQIAFAELIQSIDDVLYEYETLYQAQKEKTCQ